MSMEREQENYAPSHKGSSQLQGNKRARMVAIPDQQQRPETPDAEESLHLIDLRDALDVIRRDLRGVDLMARGAGSTLGAMYLMEPLCGALQGITEAIDDVELRIERAWTGAAA